MSKGWMRVREAATLLSVSESTVRRRIAEGQLRGRSGESGRQEVFLPAKLRAQAQPKAQAQDEAGAQQPKLSILNEVNDGDAALKDVPDTSSTLSDANGPSEELMKRYERLAGGSLVLAQKRSDELTQAASAAYENLAHARQNLRQVRKVALAGWITAAGALALAFVLSLAFGLDSAHARAAAEADQQAAKQAEREARQLRRDLTKAQAGLASAIEASHASAE